MPNSIGLDYLADMKWIYYLIVLMIFTSCQQSNQSSGTVDELPYVMKVEEFYSWKKNNISKPTFVNFWATWCKPCIEEMPLLMKAAEENPEIPFFYFSLDDKDIEKAVTAEIKKRGWKGRFHIIDVTDYNEFIDNVSTSWDGSIPFSIMFGSNKEKIKSGEFQNIKEVNQFLKNTH